LFALNSTQHYIDENITKQSTAHGAQILYFQLFWEGQSWFASIITSNPTYFALVPCANNRIFMFYTFPSGCELDASVAQDFQSFNFVSGINQQ